MDPVIPSLNWTLEAAFGPAHPGFVCLAWLLIIEVSERFSLGKQTHVLAITEQLNPISPTCPWLFT